MGNRSARSVLWLPATEDPATRPQQLDGGQRHVPSRTKAVIGRCVGRGGLLARDHHVQVAVADEWRDSLDRAPVRDPSTSKFVIPARLGGSQLHLGTGLTDAL